MDTLEVPPLSPSSTEALSQALQAGFSGFTRERNQRHVPADPRCWSLWEVNYWLDWCQAEFGLRDLGPDLRALQGLDLCGLDRESFLGLTSDGAAGEILWEHLKSMQRETDSVKVPHSGHSDGVDSLSRTGPVQDSGPVPGTGVSPAAFTLPQTHTAALTAVSGYTGGRSIQLWQFLLELLTDGSCQSFISWTGNGWEFKLTDPDQVALLWGRRKNKPKMNYEKLSRGLRYYYDKNIIRKTSGQRYVYRFVCNLQGLLGYQAGEPRARLDAVHQQEPQTTKTA